MIAEMERRRYPRIPVHYDVLCKVIDGPSEAKLRAIVENVSRTGLKLRASNFMKRNSLLKLDILKTISSKPITAYGKVVWEKESPLVYGEVLTGVEITKIGWTETDRLVNNRGI